MTASHRWTLKQIEAIRLGAGFVPVHELVRWVNKAGPARTVGAVVAYAFMHRISLRVTPGRERPPGWQRSEWTGPEDALLRMLAGQVPRETLVARLNQQFGTSRTTHSVQQRAQRLGVSTRHRGVLGLMELVRIFPIHNRQVGRWVDAGLLRVERRGDGRKGSDWRFRTADVEAFIRSQPHLFDWRAVKAGPWRDLVRSVTLRDPWLSVARAATAAGISQGMLQKWLRAGRVHGAIRLGRHRSAPWRIPTSVLPAIDRLVVETFGTGRPERKGLSDAS